MSDAELFVKRLTRNELGLTGANTLGEIYVPRNCLSFFPELGQSDPPECSFTVTHVVSRHSQSFTAFVTLYPKKEAHLRKMKPVLGSYVEPGDLLVLRRLSNHEFEACAIGGGSVFGDLLVTLLGDRVAMVANREILRN